MSNSSMFVVFVRSLGLRCIATDCHVIESFDPFEEISIDYRVNLRRTLMEMKIPWWLWTTFQSLLNYFQ
jgi:hypothetical protein